MRLLLILKVVLISAGIFLTNHGLIRRLDYYLDSQLWFPLLVFAAIWFFALVAIFYIAFTPRRVERVAWSVVICLAVLFGETYYQVVADRLTLFALDAMWAPTLVNMDIVAFYGNYALEAAARVSPLLLGLLIPYPAADKRLRWRGLVALPLVPYVLLCGLIFYVGGAETRETSAMPAQFLVPGLLTVFAVSSPPDLEKRAVDLPIVHPSELKHIVLIVDESISGDFIDLNVPVPRGTTPFLTRQAGSVINFGLALSGSNCSNASNALLRLGANPERLGTGEPGILANPSIWKYAQNAGFETNYVEAQYITGKNLNFMNPGELELIQHIETYDARTKNSQLDIQLAGQLAGILSRPEPQFVYVNKWGAHFPYHRSYPETETVFSPALGAYEAISDREMLVNSYKNAVRWSVDHFFETLLPEIDLSESVLIYTSDHGQNLMDDGEPVTHCRKLGVTLAEAVVPLLVWTGDDELHHSFEQAAMLNYGRASHFEIFPTLLELFGYDPLAVRTRYHQDLFEKIDTPMGFTSGPVIGRFNRKVTWHPRDGLESFSR